MRQASYSSIFAAILLLPACGDDSAESDPAYAAVLESRSQALASVTTLVNLVSTSDSGTRTYPVVLVPGLDGEWSAGFRLLCNNCDYALSAFGFSSATAFFAPTYQSEEALFADNEVEDLTLVDLPLEPNMSPSPVLAAYRVVDATEPETPRYLVRLRARPELPYVTTCESFLRVTTGSVQTVPINKNVLAYWRLPAALPRLECAYGTAKLPAPAPAPDTWSWTSWLTPTAILGAWTATRPVPDIRAERYPYLVTRADGLRQGFAIDCSTAAYDALASFGVAASDLRTTPAAEADLEATRFGARPTLRCRGNNPERILAITSPDDLDGRVRFVFEGHRDVIEFTCPETEAFWTAQAGDARVEIPLGALSSLNDFRDDRGYTAIRPIGCRYLPLDLHMHQAIQWPGSYLCVSAVKNMTAKEPVQLESCSGTWNGPATKRQAWSYDNRNGLFWHQTNDDKTMLLDHPLGSPAGTQTEIYPLTALDSQRWSLSSGVVVSEGLCLDVSYGNIAQEARLWFWPCHGGPAQRFFFPGDGTIRPVAAPNLCVDNQGNRRADGNPVQLYGCNGTPAQQWWFNGQQLRNQQGCLDLDISQGVKPGSLAQLWTTCVIADNQGFYYFGQIKNKQGHCLDVRTDVEGAGAVLQGGACTGAWSQDFYYVP